MPALVAVLGLRAIRRSRQQRVTRRLREARRNGLGITPEDARRMCAEFRERHAGLPACTCCAGLACQHEYPPPAAANASVAPQEADGLCCTLCHHYDPQARCPHYYPGGVPWGECVFCGYRLSEGPARPPSARNIAVDHAAVDHVAVDHVAVDTMLTA